MCGEAECVDRIALGGGDTEFDDDMAEGVEALAVARWVREYMYDLGLYRDGRR